MTIPARRTPLIAQKCLNVLKLPPFFVQMELAFLRESNVRDLRNVLLKNQLDVQI
jgi:hypothetical protein